MRKILLTLLLLCIPAWASAQITPPYTFTAGQTILSSQVNANFAKFADALNRAGGTITGNITVSAGVTIDGVDISSLTSPTTFQAGSRGLVDAPVYSFAADPDTGMWSSGNGALEWSLNGSQYLALNTTRLGLTGQLHVSDDILVNTDKFTVDGATGNTIIQGTLNVGGAITGSVTNFTGNLSGDVTSTGMTTTLATVNATVGTFGDGTKVAQVTVNAKGLVTAVTEQAISVSGTVPADMVGFFVGGTCPSGWAEYTTARGRYIVALPAGGTDEFTVGTALTDKQALAAGAHVHGGSTLGVSITDAGHTHGGGSVVAGSSGNSTDGGAGGDWIDTLAAVGTATTGITASITGNTDSAGSYTTNAPYVQLIACRKS